MPRRLVNSALQRKGDLEGAVGLVERALILHQEILILALTPAGTLTSGKLVNLSYIRPEDTNLLPFSDSLSDTQRPTPILLCS